MRLYRHPPRLGNVVHEIEGSRSRMWQISAIKKNAQRTCSHDDTKQRPEYYQDAQQNCSATRGMAHGMQNKEEVGAGTGVGTAANVCN